MVDKSPRTSALAQHDLDEFDRRILTLLTQDARRTGEELSECVGLSSAACLRRVQRLRKTGVIEREIAIVAPAYVEDSTTFVVLLEIESHRPKNIDLFAKTMGKQPEVERIFSVTGDSDLVLVLKCRSMQAYAAFSEKFFGQNPVAGYETLVTYREYPTLN